MKTEDLVKGSFYTNGKDTRQLMTFTGPPRSGWGYIDQRWCTYKVIVGPGAKKGAEKTCTVASFAKWAREEISIRKPTISSLSRQT